jgi:hypothetical protein
MDIMGTEKKREAGERREKSRFPIGRELRFKLLEDTRVLEAGTGETVNMGSGGVLFSAKKDLQPGLFVELSISWPVLLGGDCAMRLVAFGRVLRSKGGITACTIDKYEFRTQARAAVTPISVNRGDSMLLRWANGVRKESMRASVVSA